MQQAIHVSLDTPNITTPIIHRVYDWPIANMANVNHKKLFMSGNNKKKKPYVLKLGTAMLTEQQVY